MKNLYNSRSWKVQRLEHLRRWPWCKYCLDQGRKIPATVVDHIKPHRGNTELFFDRLNWQSLCKTCHDSTKQRFEKSGVIQGCDANGTPVDPRHHWNRADA